VEKGHKNASETEMRAQLAEQKARELEKLTKDYEAAMVEGQTSARETEQRAEAAERKAREFGKHAKDYELALENGQKSARDTELRAQAAETRASELEQLTKEFEVAMENGQKTALETELRAQAAEKKACDLEKLAKDFEAATRNGQQTARQWSTKFAGHCFKSGVAQVVLERKEAALRGQLEHFEEASVGAVKVVELLQHCIDAGNVTTLQETLARMESSMVSEDQQRAAYGTFARVVVPFYHAACAKLRSWLEILATVRAVLKSVAPLAKVGAIIDMDGESEI